MGPIESELALESVRISYHYALKWFRADSLGECPNADCMFGGKPQRHIPHWFVDIQIATRANRHLERKWNRNNILMGHCHLYVIMKTIIFYF